MPGFVVGAHARERTYDQRDPPVGP
jgi:hypothetical protein